MTEQRATGWVTVVTGHGLDKDKMTYDTKTTQFSSLLGEVVGDEPTASAVQGVSMKASHSLHYGQGTWDKVPYSIEVFSGVSVPCQADAESIVTATNMANQLAVETAVEYLATAKDQLEYAIATRLYKELFDE